MIGIWKLETNGYWTLMKLVCIPMATQWLKSYQEDDAVSIYEIAGVNDKNTLTTRF